MMKFKKISTLVFFMGIAACPANAMDFFQAGPAGMAGAHIAVGRSVDGIMINSSATQGVRKKQAAASYANLYPGLATDSIHLNEVSFLYPFRAGMNFSFAWQELSTDLFKSSIFQAGIAGDASRIIPIVTHPLIVSMDAVILQRNFISNAFTAVDPLFSGGRSSTGFTLNINFYGEILPRLTWGAVFHHLLRPDMGLKQGDRINREGGFGLAYSMKTALLALDISAGSTRTTVRAGMEKSFFNDRFQFRTGYAFGDNRMSNLSAGMGLKFSRGPRGARLNYAYTLSLSGASRGTAGIHQVGGVLEF